MKKLLITVLIFSNSAFAKSPFNGAFLFGDLSAIVGSIEAAREVPDELDEKKTKALKDSLSPIIPCFSIGFGVMRLCNRCLIIAFDAMAKVKTQSSYNATTTKISIKDNAFVVGAGIRLGILLNGKSFMYVNALMTNIKIHVKSSNTETFQMDNFKKNGLIPEIRIGAVLGITTNSFCDVHVSFSKKSYKQPISGASVNLLEIKRKFINIGVSYVYRFKKF